MSNNKVAVVTGASRGIGKRVSVDLASKGYDVVCTARSTSDSPGKLEGTIDETAKLVEEQGAKAMTVGLDVRDADAVQALADRVYGEWGRVDLLINNAAVAPPGTVARRSRSSAGRSPSTSTSTGPSTSCTRSRRAWTRGV